MKIHALLFALVLAAPAHAVPTEIEAHYRIDTSGITIGRVSESYVRTADTYRIESTTRSEGLFKLFLDDTVVLRSAGRLVAGGLQPLHFEQRRAGAPDRDILATFDWSGARLRSEYRGETTTVPLPPGTQDRLSVMYQFMNMLPGSTEVRMYMSNGRKVERYAYRKVDEPLIKTPAGEFATVHYERITEDAHENKAQLWLAKEHDNLAVRVVFEDTRGLKLEQTLVGLTTR
jgi:hypothetical protein